VTSVTGRWRITEMDMWDREAIDLVQPGFFEFTDDGFGSVAGFARRSWRVSGKPAGAGALDVEQSRRTRDISSRTARHYASPPARAGERPVQSSLRAGWPFVDEGHGEHA
jgi:hypothetical protein